MHPAKRIILREPLWSPWKYLNYGWTICVLKQLISRGPFQPQAFSGSMSSKSFCSGLGFSFFFFFCGWKSEIGPYRYSTFNPERKNTCWKSCNFPANQGGTFPSLACTVEQWHKLGMELLGRRITMKKELKLWWALSFMEKFLKSHQSECHYSQGLLIILTWNTASEQF